MSLKKILCIPDIQAPKHDETAVSTAVSIVKGEKPDILIYMGDFIANDSVARFSPKQIQDTILTADIEIASANSILDRFDHVTPKKCKKIFLEGNHEERLEAYIAQHAWKLGPNFKGINIRDQLRCKERGYVYISKGEQPYKPCKKSKISFLHGEYVRKHHARLHSDNYRRSLIYGHTHDVQCVTEPHIKGEFPGVVMSIGCLCDYNQSYNKGKVSRWQHCVGMVYLNEKTGRFQAFPHRIIDGWTIVNGREYNGS